MQTILNAQIGKVLWQEDFNAFNPSVWNYVEGDESAQGICGWGNAEMESHKKGNVTN